MKLDEAELKRLYQMRTARPRDEGCLAEEDLVAAVSPATDPAARERVARHVAGCSDCAKLFRHARELEAWAAGARVAGPERAHSPRGRLAAWRAVAAAAAVAAASLSLAVWWSSREPVSAPPAVRSGATAPAAVTPADGATLGAPPDRLSWPAAEGARGYRVVLYDAESTPVWESELVREPFVVLPAGVRERLGAGDLVLWRVTTLAEVDERRSELFRFTVVR